MNEIEHGKLVTTTTNQDGTSEIMTETYYDGELSGLKKEKEVSVITSKKDYLKDLIEASNVFSKREARTLTLVIEADASFEPKRIVRRWAVVNEKYGRK